MQCPKRHHVRKFNFFSIVVSHVRLVGGAAANEGRVEIYYMGEWGTVCSYGWDVNDATVICRQLGYSRGISAIHGASYGEGSGKIWMNAVGCRGNEMGLHQCPIVDYGCNFCDHSEDAGVICGKLM